MLNAFLPIDRHHHPKGAIFIVAAPFDSRARISPTNWEQSWILANTMLSRHLLETTFSDLDWAQSSSLHINIFKPPARLLALTAFKCFGLTLPIAWPTKGVELGSDDVLVVVNEGAPEWLNTGQKIVAFFCRPCGEYHSKTHPHYRAMKRRKLKVKKGEARRSRQRRRLRNRHEKLLNSGPSKPMMANMRQRVNKVIIVLSSLSSECPATFTSFYNRSWFELD